ncbi:uncharacterized protein LOC117821816 [Notolabrus celidotus]|uniref:uncharacterized protein LOC117821816 n=1 Tax=Notolabrus celidotus TaxID=1203425 RepID=UPI00148FCE0D|nr:uncharacterized protein LOC117821816 [Notolabrus celidotus]XP_034552220.1 uncharacterized protein LOC117821816 [Notolabrus celidotus]
MKILLIVLVLLDIPPLKGQQRIKESEHILLKFAFPSFYNSYSKSCCKLYPGGCYKLLDSTGYTCDLLKGRVTKMENNGWIEFKISNVQFVDGGYYRCIVLGADNRIYRDYFVEVFEVSGHPSRSQPSTMTTMKTPNTTTSLPESTGPVLAQDHSDSPRALWGFSLPLVVIVSITVMLFITSVIGVVFCRVKAKQKQSDKYGDTPHESFKQEASDTSGIVYTTVDFKAHQKPTEVYANLKTHKTQSRAPDSTWSAEHGGMVEYSTLAVHQ